MAALDLTSFDAALKKYYTDERVRNLVYQNRPLLALIRKNTRVGGKSFEVPITIGPSTGRSKTFSDAKADKNPSTHKRFSMTRTKNYGLADIDGETIRASVGDRNAFMEAVTSEIDITLRNLSNDLAHNLYGSSSGKRGVVSGAPVADVITLATPEDVHAFEVGMHIETAATETGSIVVADATVVAVDRDAGTITVDDDTGILDTHFIFAKGDGSDGGLRPDKLSGLDAWLPTSVTATPFFGVDRTDDPVRLAGVKYDAASAGDDTEEGVVNAGAKLFTEGGSPDMCFVHPTRMAILDRLLEQRGRYDKVQSSDAEVGFESIVVHTGGGTVRVIADPWCPKNTGCLLQMDTWTLFSIGQAPGILMHDGNRFLRNGDADSVEVQAGYYAQLAGSAPGYNCRITFGAT